MSTVDRFEIRLARYAASITKSESWPASSSRSSTLACSASLAISSPPIAACFSSSCELAPVSSPAGVDLALAFNVAGTISNGRLRHRHSGTEQHALPPAAENCQASKLFEFIGLTIRQQSALPTETPKSVMFQQLLLRSGKKHLFEPGMRKKYSRASLTHLFNR